MLKVSPMPKVMIAEDDLVLADMLEDVLVERGYDVCGIACTVDKAVELAERHKPDLAILDIRLAEGGLGTDIAARLKDQGRMGVLYASGNVGPTDLTKADGDALLVKPYRTEDVIDALRIVENVVSTDEASRRFPKGFSLLDRSSGNDTAPAAGDGETDRQNARLRRQQSGLARFGTFALAERNLGTVLAEAARRCTECLGVPYCTVYRYRPGKRDLFAETGVGWNQGVIGRVASRADATSPQGRVFVTQRPLICGDLRIDASLVPPACYAEHGIITTLAVIVGRLHQPDGIPYGVLEIASPAAQDYDDFDIDFLTGLANVLAASVDAAKLRTADRDQSIAGHAAQ